MGSKFPAGRPAASARVFASLGPSGKLLMMGEVSEEELLATFAEQAQALAEAGADALIFETMSDLAEAKVGVQAARATGLPVSSPWRSIRQEP